MSRVHILTLIIRILFKKLLFLFEPMFFNLTTLYCSFQEPEHLNDQKIEKKHLVYNYILRRRFQPDNTSITLSGAIISTGSNWKLFIGALMLAGHTLKIPEFVRHFLVVFLPRLLYVGLLDSQWDFRFVNCHA